MGYNSIVLVLNDTLADIEKDPEFGKKLVQAIREWPLDGPKRKRIQVMGRSQAAVIGQEHADVLQVVAVGGNGHVYLGHGGWQNTTHELLARVADQHGFKLVRKSAKDLGARQLPRHGRGCPDCADEMKNRTEK